MAAKSEKKSPTKRKRATPLSFKKDEKVDSIVKEITENLKNSSETEAKLEEEIKLEVQERTSVMPTEEKSEGVIDEPIEKEEEGKATGEDEKTEEPVEAPAEEIKPDEEMEASASDEKREEELPAVFSPGKTDNPFPPLEDEPKKSFKWPLIYFILFLAGMIAGFVVFDQLSQRSGGNSPIRIGTSSPTPTKTPATPTEAPLDLSKYTIMLENGSGTAGVAADLQTQLEAADFTVAEIGNADKSTYDQTVIQVKNGTNTQFLDALREEVEKTYVVSKETEELPDSEEFDAVVIIGSQTADE